MEKKDQYHNPAESQNNPRLEEFTKKGEKGLLNSEEIKEGQHVKISEELAGELAIAVSQLENKIPEPIDMDVHEYVETKKYLQHAPEEFKALWKTATPADQEVYKKHVEFTVDGPNIIGASGKEYKLAKDNLTVEDKDIKKGTIDIYEGETYFTWDAMMEYTKKHKISVPTEDMYLDMLEVMPAGDVHKKYYIRGRAVKQLFILIGGKLNGGLVNGKYSFGSYGFLWTASPDDGYTTALTLAVGVSKSIPNCYPLIDQFPTRTFRKELSI